jgi:hypothetical protein
MTGIVFTGSRFVAVGYTTDLYMSAAGGLIYHSTDGVRWTRINATGFSQTTMYGLTIDAEINDVAYGNGKLIAVANFGQMAQSTDNGATWRAISSNIFGTGESGDNILSIATNGSGTWVAGAEGGYIYYSTDNGATWQKKNSGSYNSKTAFNSGVSFVTWSNGKVVAANNSAQIGYSTDGVNWTLSYPNPLLESVTKQGKINCAAYGAGKWVAWGLQHDDVPALIYTTGD